MKSASRILLSCLCMIAIVACSEAGAPRPDAALRDGAMDLKGHDAKPLDGRMPGDGTLGDVLRGDGLADLGRADGAASVCEKDCLALGLCTTVKGVCVDCTTDLHCMSNPKAIGHKCNVSTMTCGCVSNADCVNHKLGAICDTSIPKLPICSCQSKQDCTGNDGCVVSTFPGVSGSPSFCGTPCKINKDCPRKMDVPSYNICNVSTGMCGECAKDSECAFDYGGNKCLGGMCGCKDDGSCNNEATGDACDDRPLGLFKIKQCGCSAAGECNKNVWGSVCDAKTAQCYCKSAIDCKDKPGKICQPYATDDRMSYCYQGCSRNSDCTKTVSVDGLNICDTNSKRCVECRSDTDCKRPGFTTCNSLGLCSECKINADCKDALKPTCDKGLCV